MEKEGKRRRRKKERREEKKEGKERKERRREGGGRPAMALRRSPAASRVGWSLPEMGGQSSKNPSQGGASVVKNGDLEFCKQYFRERRVG